MIPYIVTIFLATVFVLFAYHVTQGNAILNLIASWGLMVLVVWLLPELRYLPFPVYMLTWLVSFAGFQILMPWAAGKPFVCLWHVHGLTLAVGVNLT